MYIHNFLSNRVQSTSLPFYYRILSRNHSFSSIPFFVSADEVVAYEHGEKAVQALTSIGFQNITFRSYEGYTLSKHLLNNGTLMNIYTDTQTSGLIMWVCYAG